MLIARTLPELRAATADANNIALVPTMGALHAGHLSLLRAAKASGGISVASIFVNPLQFGPNEDFAAYPRDEAGDLAQLAAAGCDVVWLPAAAIMYPPAAACTIVVAGPALRWEGERRPGHFAGVATVVAKLFGQVRPARAYFGEKDWQQVQVLRRVVEDLVLPVDVVAVPTVREPDGLALSSRNRFLKPAERAAAPALYAALQNAAQALRPGLATAHTLHDADATLSRAGMAVDYMAVVDPITLEPLEIMTGPARLLAAAKLGAVRLLDNIPAVV